MTTSDCCQWDDLADVVADHLTELEEVYLQAVRDRDEARFVARHIATFATHDDGAARLVDLEKRFPWLDWTLGTALSDEAE